MGASDLQLTQGDTWNTYVRYEQPKDTPVDLTGYTANCKVKKTPTSTAVLDLSTSTSGLTIPTPANGQIHFDVSAATMAAIEPGVYCYDLELIDGSGVKTTILAGTLTIVAEITD